MTEVEIEALITRLKKRLSVAERLGLTIVPGGGYSTGYSLFNLPPHAVGLFGALSIVEGEGSRSKLGLTYKQTRDIELGFDIWKDDNKFDKKRKMNAYELVGYRLGEHYKPKQLKKMMPRLAQNYPGPPQAPPPQPGWGFVAQAAEVDVVEAAPLIPPEWAPINNIIIGGNNNGEA